MTEQEIIEGNKLIAEFMAYKEPKIVQGSLKWEQGFLKHKFELQYHTSWDWLMPVVEKIGSIIYKDTNWQKFYSLAELLHSITNKTSRNYLINSMESIFKAVVEFIKWYNQNKKSL